MELLDRHSDFALTQREVIIIAYFMKGRNLRYVCNALFISYNTGKTHVKHIYEKLDVSNRQELIDVMEKTPLA